MDKVDLILEKLNELSNSVSEMEKKISQLEQTVTAGNTMTNDRISNVVSHVVQIQSTVENISGLQQDSVEYLEKVGEAMEDVGLIKENLEH